MTPQKFRKKPVVIEAMQYTEKSGDLIREWVPGSYFAYIGKIVIPTLEGNITASFGDWIIKGVQGEFYPCKPDIFELTYEAVGAAGYLLQEGE